MEANEYQRLARRTAGPSMLSSVLGLCGEAGEVADLTKKTEFHGHKADLSKLKKELGDVLWYVSDLCNHFEFSLSEVMDANIEKLKKRYPDGFSCERSINREDSTND